MNKPAVFFDRDGTLNHILFEDNGSPRSPRTFEEFKLVPDAKLVLDETKARGYYNLIVSNQPEIERGLLPTAEHEKIQDCVKSVLAVDDAFICLHDNHHDCVCRKPKPGMILAAAEKWEIDLSRSYMVGDTNKDALAAKSAGVKCIIIDAPYNTGVQAEYHVKNLKEILDIIK